MQPVIGCDAHKKFSVFVSVDQHGKPSQPVRVDHDRDLYCEYLRTLPPASEIALEATGHGSTCRNVNHYLKWAFVEAANCAIRMKAHREDHIGLLYQRLYPNKGHGRSVVAVARHLAEASYWVLRKKQHYRAPQPRISN